MLAWISTNEQKYKKTLVNVVSQQTITVRGKYFSFLQMTLEDGSIVTPHTVRWVNKEAPKLSPLTLKIRG